MSIFLCCGNATIAHSETMIQLIRNLRPDKVLIDYILDNPECVNEHDEVSLISLYFSGVGFVCNHLFVLYLLD
jgi:hypothetical protein